MKLEDHIRASIYRYPTLYRANDYAESRLYVLNHLFLVIGNGYEWHRDGYLTSGKKEGRKTLPKNYFEMDLYEIETQKPEELKKALKAEGLFFYSLERGRHGGEVFVFESRTDEQLAKCCQEYSIPNQMESILYRLKDFSYMKLRMEYPVHPYPICQYSAIQEILNGKTNSLHQDNFDLVVQPDWLQGCADIAVEAKKYYNDRSRYENDHYFKQFSKNAWHKYRKEQLDILNQFLDKYGT